MLKTWRMWKMPPLIGIVGKKRHGKDEVAKAFEAHGFRRTAFADPLKRHLMEIYDLSYEQCYGTTEQKEAIDPRYGVSARLLMQRFGTEVGRHCYEATWCEAVFNQDIRLWEGFGLEPEYVTEWRLWRWRVERDDYGYTFSHKGQNWVFADCRFPDEADEIRRRGGKIVRVVRPDYPDDGDQHASEVEQEKIKADFLIVNGGTLNQLKEIVDQLVKEMA